MNPTNLGPAQANRRGCPGATIDGVCLIDSDVPVPQGWLGRLVAEFERRPGVTLLAPLNYHQTLSHPLGPENSEAPGSGPRNQYNGHRRSASSTPTPAA